MFWEYRLRVETDICDILGECAHAHEDIPVATYTAVFIGKVCSYNQNMHSKTVQNFMNLDHCLYP